MTGEEDGASASEQACCPGSRREARKPRAPRCTSYFRFSVAAATGFGLLSALDTVPGVAAPFFLSVLGFFASRFVLF
jgi:hypothetical protein